MILFETRMPADLLALSALRKDVSARLLPLGASQVVKNALLLVLSEMGANAICHGVPAPAFLDIRLRLDGRALVIEIEDDGGPFAAFDTRMKAASRIDMASLAEDGRGLAIVQGLCEDMRYQAGPPNRFVGRIAFGHTQPAILVVEDSPILLETYCAMLAQEYRVLRAETLEGAIAVARAERIDGIVTDLHLEGRQGCELVSLLEADAESPPVPVLVITAERDAERLDQVARRGVEQVLAKPVTAAVLRQAVAAMLARAARNNARIFRYFGSSIDHEATDDVPAKAGPFRLHALSGRAGFGRGDFLCSMPIAGGRRILLADVMGHGLAAQLAGMQFKAALLGISGALPDADCAEFLAAVSRTLSAGRLMPGTYLTMLVVDLFDDGQVDLAGAGHPRPIAVIDGVVRMVETDGPLPGLIDGVVYPKVRLQLGPHDRLFLPTDGIDPRAETVGRHAPDWLENTLRAGATTTFEVLITRLEGSLLAMLTHAPTDDWTLLAIEREPGDQAAAA